MPFAGSDCQPYMKSSKKVFVKNTNHPRHVYLADKRDRDDNKMERLNGEIRDREKVFRGLKRLDTLLIDELKASTTSQRNTAL